VTVSLGNVLNMWYQKYCGAKTSLENSVLRFLLFSNDAIIFAKDEEDVR
jgi:hypothetical protein